MGPHRVTVGAPVSFSKLLQPVEPFVSLPQPIFAVDHRHFYWQPSFGFESPGTPSI